MVELVFHKTLSSFDIWGIVTLNLSQKKYFWIFFISILSIFMNNLGLCGLQKFYKKSDLTWGGFF